MSKTLSAARMPSLKDKILAVEVPVAKPKKVKKLGAKKKK